MPDRYRFSITDFKSSFRNLTYSFFYSREKLRDRSRDLRCRLKASEARCQQLLNENRRLKQQLEKEKSNVSMRRPVTMKSVESALNERPLPGHHFGAKMISFCCQMFKKIGFRATEKVIGLIGQWLGVNLKVPTRGAIRNWACRHGIAVLQQSQQQADDWIWLVDHHVPIGNMVALVVLGIRQSELPNGRPLRREDMKPLAVLPCYSRRKEHVQQALEELAEQIKAPICVIVDGANELHEGVKALQKQGQDVLLVDDIKHKAANILKRLLKTDDRFVAFESQLGKTIATIQQTELDHFLPPKKRTKCRFMNLGKLIDWANMVLHHHGNPKAAGLQGISADRFEQKLGWIKEFEPDLQQWTQIRQIISVVLAFTNERGVYAGSVDDLKEKLSALTITTELPHRVTEALLACCQANELKLTASKHSNLRVPCSSEVLESSFADYKYLQRNQTRGTFTSLLATYPTLFSVSDPETIAQHLKHVSTKSKNIWLQNNKLKNSTQIRKTRAYKAALG